MACRRDSEETPGENGTWHTITRASEFKWDERTAAENATLNRLTNNCVWNMNECTSFNYYKQQWLYLWSTLALKRGVEYRLRKKKALLSRTAGGLSFNTASHSQSIFITRRTFPPPHDAFGIKAPPQNTIEASWFSASKHKNPEKSAIISYNYINLRIRIHARWCL